MKRKVGPVALPPGSKVTITFEAELANGYKPGDRGVFYLTANGGRRFLFFSQGTVKAVKQRGRLGRPKVRRARPER